MRPSSVFTSRHGGSAPDIAGKGIANPIATILECSHDAPIQSLIWIPRQMPLKQAVEAVLHDGYRTIDIMPREGESMEGITQVGTAEMGDLICRYIVE